MAIKYLKPNTLKDQTVLLRGSLDVPLDEATREVADDFRLHSLAPTLRLLLKAGNKVVLCGKLGRPEGRRDEAYSLLPVAKKLAQVLDLRFAPGPQAPENLDGTVYFFAEDVREERNLKKVKQIAGTGIVCLENLEFYKQELENDPVFGKKLASLGDAYVDEDFSKCHHVCASNQAVTKYAPASYAGPGLEKEIQALSVLLGRVQHPSVVMMGGIKISEKAKTLEHLGERADTILLGGGLANLIFLSKGLEIGRSKVEHAAEKTAWHIEKNFKHKLVLPVDLVVANEQMDTRSIRVTTPYEIGKNEIVLDCGPKTILEFSKVIKAAKTIVWNGPLGHFEVQPFHTATMALARLVGGRGKGRAFTVVGGGETVDAVRQAHQTEHIDHLSTGGGAMLEFLTGKKLPGIEALK